jgi:hypothetical protein
MKTFTTGMRDIGVVSDRLSGMTFKAIVVKRGLRNPTQARVYYQNTLAHLVHDSDDLKKAILDTISRITSPQNSDNSI